MCGSGASNNGKGQSSSSKGTFNGFTAGQINGFNNANIGGMMTGLSHGAATAWAKGQTTTAGGTSAVAEPKQTLGAPKVDAPKVGALMQRAAPVAHMTAFNDMQTAIDEGEVVNAATYSGLYNRDMVAKKARADVQDMTKTSRVMGTLGTFTQNPDAHPLNRMQSTFNPNRGVVGSFLDKMTGHKRGLSMRESLKSYRAGTAKDMASTLASGNTEVDENGKPQMDVLGTVLDVASIVPSVVTRSPFGIGKGLFDFAQNASRQSGLYEENKSTKPATPVSSSSPKAQRTVTAKGSNPVAGMMGGDGGGRTLFASTAGMGGPEEEKKAVAAKAAPKKVKRGRRSLLLTGGRGLEETPQLLFNSLRKG
ncbi:MAG: hypothetical protein JEY79_01055 [Pseudodesulfovibrio sp.]|nr:hypothetical protein [Pseudodesulfovibrio sp.]